MKKSRSIRIMGVLLAAVLALVSFPSDSVAAGKYSAKRHHHNPNPSDYYRDLGEMIDESEEQGINESNEFGTR